MHAINKAITTSARRMARSVGFSSVLNRHPSAATCHQDEMSATSRAMTSVARVPLVGGKVDSSVAEGVLLPARRQGRAVWSLARCVPSSSRCPRSMRRFEGGSATSAVSALGDLRLSCSVAVGGSGTSAAMSREGCCHVSRASLFLLSTEQRKERDDRNCHVSTFSTSMSTVATSAPSLSDLAASAPSLTAVATSAAMAISGVAKSNGASVEEVATSASSIGEGATSVDNGDVAAHRYISPLPSSRGTEVVIALGSNVGNRLENFKRALLRMREVGIHIIRHGCLYESAPAYVEDQPFFLNTAVSAYTELSPSELLCQLKMIEKEMGRDKHGIRFGPRPLDLDIIFYGNQSIDINMQPLVVPHPRFMERAFVIAPTLDLLGSENNGAAGEHWSRHPMLEGGLKKLWQHMGGEDMVGTHVLRRVIPVGDQLYDWSLKSAKTEVMGILNVTPDSFSDGGQFSSLENATAQARKIVVEGASIIDIGGQSTRPGAARVSVEEELSRVMPVVTALASDPVLARVILSIDTFYAKVAEEAVSAGVAMVNDVSAGKLDPAMIPTVAHLGVPYVMMHLRGDPETMQTKESTSYEDVCRDVSQELLEQAKKAEEAGIPAWNIILDPGIGFAKTGAQSLQLLRELPRFRSLITAGSQALGHAPILVGASRKGFLGRLCNRHAPEDRDYASAAVTAAAICGGANIIRAHNVAATLDAARVGDSIWKWKATSSQSP